MNCTKTFKEEKNEYEKKYLAWLSHKLPDKPTFQDLCDWEPYVTFTQLLLIDACPETYFKAFAPKHSDYKFFGGTNFL